MLIFKVRVLFLKNLNEYKNEYGRLNKQSNIVYSFKLIFKVDYKINKTNITNR